MLRILIYKVGIISLLYILCTPFNATVNAQNRLKVSAGFFTEGSNYTSTLIDSIFIHTPNVGAVFSELRFNLNICYDIRINNTLDLRLQERIFTGLYSIYYYNQTQKSLSLNYATKAGTIGLHTFQTSVNLAKYVDIFNLKLIGGIGLNKHIRMKDEVPNNFRSDSPVNDTQLERVSNQLDSRAKSFVFSYNLGLEKDLGKFFVSLEMNRSINNMLNDFEVDGFSASLPLRTTNLFLNIGYTF